MEFGISYVDIKTVLCCLVAFLIVTWWLRRPTNLPPGPWGLPIVGYLPNIAIQLYRTGLTPHELFAKYARKYGSVFSMYIGGKLVVVLDNYNTVKEAFQNRDLSDRPDYVLFKDTDKAGGTGIVLASGEPWKLQRRFTHTTLRSFGVGKTSFEENIAEEAKHVMQEITILEGQSFDPTTMLANATANVICGVVFGRRFEYTDANFGGLLDRIKDNIELLGSSGLHMFFPAAKYVQPNIHELIKQNYNTIVDFVDTIIKEHQEKFDPDNLNDYIDVYLNEIEMAKTSNLKSAINRHNLIVLIVDLFGAGTETTSTTLCWALLYMIAYPEVQEKIQKEIDSVVGRNRLPRLADKTELPFTRATLLEIQRVGAIAPLGVLHYSGNDTALAGYNIPKGSVVISNLWSIHNNTEAWDDPDQFNPERFLDEDGDVVDREDFIPFSIGRRICVGENLAKMELFIFFTHLLHQFTFKKPDDSPPLSLEGINGATRSPQRFMIQGSLRET